jgi:hypothetical protein
MTHPVKDLSSNLPANEANLEINNVIEALDYLNELTSLQELLKICLEENLGSESNKKNTRVELLIDCYLSRSEFCLAQLRSVLEKLRSALPALIS